MASTSKAGGVKDRIILLTLTICFVSLIAGWRVYTASADISSNLLAHYALDEGSGTAVADSSGNGNNGTGSDISWVAGKKNGAVEFDSTSDVVTLTGLTSVAGTYTVSFWAKGITTGSDDRRYLFDVSSGRLIIGWYGSAFGNTGIYDGTWQNFTETPDDGEWHQLVFVLDGDAGTSAYYEDGQLTDTGSYTATNIGGTVVLGRYNGGPSNNFTGSLDEVRIYERTLTLEEIEALYLVDCVGCSHPDTTPPTRSGGSPSGDELAEGTTETTLSLTTSETATCKYATAVGTAYASMTSTFSTTGGTSHSTTVSGLSDGASYTYYVRCADDHDNANTDDFSLSFSVTDATGATLSNLAVSNITTNSATITWTTNESATSTVAYGLSESYGSTTAATNSLSTAHSHLLSGLLDNTTYYIEVTSTDASYNDATSTTSFTTNTASTTGTLRLNVSASDTEVATGTTISFVATPEGGTPPYDYCWDFSTLPSNATKVGEWDEDREMICYSTIKNPSHAFENYGIYDVKLSVIDSAGTPATVNAFLEIGVPVGGTVLDPTTDCGANNLVGDGATNNGGKFAACIAAQSGAVTLEFPAGTYVFEDMSVNSISKDVHIKAESGAEGSVIFLLDPIEYNDLWLNLYNNLIDSGNGHTVTNNGGATFTTTSPPSGTHTLVLDGSTQYLSILDHDDFDLSGDYWWVHLYFKVDALGQEQVLYYQETDANNYMKFYVNAEGRLVLSIIDGGVEKMNNGAGLSPIPTITPGKWYTAVTKAAGAFFYVHLTEEKDTALGAATFEVTEGPIHPQNYAGNVLIGSDGTSFLDGAIDEVVVLSAVPPGLGVFFSGTGTRLVDNIVFRRKLESSEVLTSVLPVGTFTGPAFIRKTTFENVQGIWDGPSNSMIQSNIIDWGNGIDTERSAVAGVNQTLILRYMYIDSAYTSGHFYYGGGDENTMTYFVQNYLDHHTANTGSLNLITERNTYVYGNYWKADHQPIQWNYTTPYELDLVEFIGNIFDQTYIQLRTTDVTEGVKINDNQFFNALDSTNPIEIIQGVSNIEIARNIFGVGTPLEGPFSGIYYLPGDTSCDSGGADRIDDPNPNVPGDIGDITGCTYATWADNVDDESTVPISNPGRYEFVPPTVASFSVDSGAATTTSRSVSLAQSVSDAGSGMGVVARFPFTEAALMQFSNDGATWSEVSDYDTSASWTLTDGDGTKTVYARFADVDHNWATTSASVVLSTTPPIRSAGTPSDTLAEGTTETTLSLTTSETATCKYSTTANTAYASMTNTFSTTGSTSHSTTVSDLADGEGYAYFVRCADTDGNADEDDYTITFSVAESENVADDSNESDSTGEGGRRAHAATTKETPFFNNTQLSPSGFVKQSEESILLPSTTSSQTARVGTSTPEETAAATSVLVRQTKAKTLLEKIIAFLRWLVALFVRIFYTLITAK